jgi:hypothetical protein
VDASAAAFEGVKAFPRSVAWSPVWNAAHPDAGLEHLLLHDRWADGLVLAFDEPGVPYRLAYRIEWDDRWHTRAVSAHVRAAEGQRELILDADGEGHWLRNGGAAPELDGCLDVDIWPTPFTNMLPIRRLRLAPGVRRELSVAWVNAPALTVAAMAQAYTRRADRSYHFESLGSGFRAELEVDEDGLVLDYPGLFERRYP